MDKCVLLNYDRNKKTLYQKKEESSSLTNTSLLFVRRKDITVFDRCVLGLASLSPKYRSTSISSLAQQYGCSRQFIYNQGKLLNQNAKHLFGIKDKQKELNHLLLSMRFHLTGKLFTKSSLHGLSSLGKEMDISYTSTSFISQTLEVAGSLLSSTYNPTNPQFVIALCDEVYSGGNAILVTLDAASMVVLDIKLLTKPLDALAWKKRFLQLEQHHITICELIKDQGKSMQSASSVLPEWVSIIADVFHAVPHRLGIYHRQLIRKTENSLFKEDELKVKIMKAKSNQMRNKQSLKYEKAKAKTALLLDQLDWFEQAYFLLINQLRPFDAMGVPRDKQQVKQNITFALEALTLLSIAGIDKELKHIKKLLDKEELLGFMNKVPALYKKWKKRLHGDTLWLWILYWQYWKKSFQTHSPKVQTAAKEQANAAAKLLEEHYTSKQEQMQFERIRTEIFTHLDTIVQASSLVETFNSILKPFINNTRGQLSQSLLNLVKFYHNHRIFNKRSKRGGKAPVEILTGQQLQKSWIDLLMDKIKEAFEKHKVKSLKDLHQIVCKKAIPKIESVKLPKKETSQQVIATIAA
jgi:hypothetical protein